MFCTLHTYRRSICYCIVLLHFHVIYLSGLNLKKQALRIIGGRNATPGEFPYVLGMGLQGLDDDNPDEFTHLCTCFLLKASWSLTSAHCIKPVQKYLNMLPKLRAVVQYNSFSSKETSVILSFVLHSSYTSSDTYQIRYNDIGLLQTAGLPMTTFAKISFVDYSTLYGHEVSALGYGLTDGPNNSYGTALKVNKSLQVLEAIVVRCGEAKTVPSFCLVGPCDQWSAVCPGDSGGPVLHPSGIVGINTATDPRNCHAKTAMAPRHKLFTFAGIITPVSSFVDWIAKVIRESRRQETQRAEPKEMAGSGVRPSGYEHQPMTEPGGENLSTNKLGWDITMLSSERTARGGGCS